MDGPKFPKRAEAGAVIGGCELVRRIGRGGMAEVWVARKALGTKSGKSVALKLIADHYVGDERYARMFRAEAELAAALTHANIVQVFDEGEDEGRSYLVMEWVDGVNLLKLGDMLALLDDEQRRFRVISYIIGQLLHALNYAHSITSADGNPLGVVHRDVSPQNVLVSNHGEVKLTDFGVAHHNFEESSGVHVKGKVRYMAPEQLAGRTRSPTVDLYAVGALLHELLDGRKFRGELEDGQDLFTAVLQGHVFGLSRPVPPELDHLRLCLLQPDPAQRIQSAEQAFSVLKRYPGYGDARDELTKLCSSLTGVVRPRAGLGQSSQVPAADQSTTKWNGRKGLAAPNVAPNAGGRIASPPGGPQRTGSTTTVKGTPASSSTSHAQITGHTEFVRPAAVAPTVPLRVPSFGADPKRGSDPSVRPIDGTPAYASSQGSSPIPLYVHGSPSGPLDVQPSGQVWLEPSNPSLLPSGSTEVLGPDMMAGGSGSGTDQLPARHRHDEGTDTGRVAAGPSHTGSNSTVAPARPSSTVALIGLGLVLVALCSVAITWLIVTSGRQEASDVSDPAAAAGGAKDVAPNKPVAEQVEPRKEASLTERTPEPVPLRRDPPEQTQSAVLPDDAAQREALELTPAPIPRPPLTEDAENETAPVPEPVPEPMEEPPAEVKKPRVTVKVFGDPMLPKLQLKIDNKVIAMRGSARVVVGRRKIQWRSSDRDKWQTAASQTFTAGKDVVVYITKDGPKFR